MSDVNFEGDEAEDQGTRNPLRAHMRKLEDETKTLREQLAAAQSAQRELAFVKAGVDLNAPGAKYFVKGYDGELSPEAIRAAAEEANLVPKAAQAPEVKSEQQAWTRLQKAAAAGQTSEPPVDWVARMNSAKSIEEVQALLAQARQETQNL
jgi:hypothetical protein